MVTEKIVLSPLLDVSDGKFNHKANEQACDDPATKLLLDLSLRASDCVEYYAIPSALLVSVVLSCDLSYTLS